MMSGCVNKRYTKSTFSFSTAICNAVFLKNKNENIIIKKKQKIKFCYY